MPERAEGAEEQREQRAERYGREVWRSTCQRGQEEARFDCNWIGWRMSGNR
eukprot:SAG11_NODE_114_length_16040_cov_10.050875_14_plen_51_part_00